MYELARLGRWLLLILIVVAILVVPSFEQVPEVIIQRDGCVLGDTHPSMKEGWTINLIHCPPGFMPDTLESRLVYVKFVPVTKPIILD